MKVSHLLVIAVLATGCTGATTDEPQNAEPAPAAIEQPAPVATEQPTPTTGTQQKTRAAPQREVPPPKPQISPATLEKAAEANANPDALVLVDFTQRINKYLAVRKGAAKDAPRMKETDDPAKIQAAQKGLAATLRAARMDARPGDIFTPEIRNKFRRLMYPQLKGEEGREAKAELKEDAPKAVPLKINAEYPEGAALPTVPPNLLLNLPTLPEELEYRIIDKHLILRDVQANIIVDFIPNAIQ